MKNVLLIFLLLGLLTACAEMEAPIEIEIFENRDRIFKITYVEVEVTALVDEVEVKSITVNRENCKPWESPKSRLPSNLGYGETISFNYLNPCKVRQVDIATNRGDWTFSFK